MDRIASLWIELLILTCERMVISATRMRARLNLQNWKFTLSRAMKCDDYQMQQQWQRQKRCVSNSLFSIVQTNVSIGCHWFIVFVCIIREKAFKWLHAWGNQSTMKHFYPTELIVGLHQLLNSMASKIIRCLHPFKFYMTGDGLLTNSPEKADIPFFPVTSNTMSFMYACHQVFCYAPVLRLKSAYTLSCHWYRVVFFIMIYWGCKEW